MIQIYFKTGKSKKLEAVFMNADMYVPCVVALEKKAKKLGAELVEEFDGRKRRMKNIAQLKVV